MSFKKISAILWLVLVAMISITVLAPALSSPQRKMAKYITESSDNKIEDALKLSAAAATASIALSAIPGDTGTPVAQKLAEFSKDILLILCVLYFEKSIYPIIGSLFFYLIIPTAVLMCLFGVLSGKRVFRGYAFSVLISGALIWLMIPAGLLASDMVYSSQQQVIEEAINTSDDLSFQIANNTDTDTSENESFLGTFVKTVSSFGSDMVEKAKNLITGYIRSLALMIVTSLIIPVAVAIFFIWLVKVIIQAGQMTGQREKEFMLPQHASILGSGTSERK